MKLRGHTADGRVTFAVIASLAVAVLAVLATGFGLGASVGYDIAWTSAAVSAVIGLLYASIRVEGANRSRWALMAFAAIAWLFGQMAWNLYGFIGFPRSPNVADIGWWLCALFVIVNMLRLPKGSLNDRLATAAESLPLMIAGVALCLGDLWGEAANSHLAAGAKFSALVYPALYVPAAILMLQALLTGVLRGVRLPARLVAAGVIIHAITFTLWSSWLLNGDYNPGHTVLDPMWVLALGLMGVGGLLASRERGPARPMQLGEPSGRGMILPAATFVVLVGSSIGAQFDGAPATGATILRLGVLFSGAALIGRSTLLGRRLRTMLEGERAARSELGEREAELARLNQQLVEDSRRDPLTGIGNRRALSDDLPIFELRRREESEEVAVALCDVDHFKAYNDRLGHLAGDQALRMIASTARGALRTEDTAYRYGGEELLLVLRGVSQEVAVGVCERVRLAVQRAAFSHPDGEGGVLTVSIGVACGSQEIGQLLARADAALYEAKRCGRNRVTTADESLTGLSNRHREEQVDGPVPRHLRSMLAVSRAASGGEGATPVVEALAEAIRSELSFHVVAVNLVEEGEDPDRTRVVTVVGDPDARETLLGATHPLADWRQMLAAGVHIHGATWLPAGSFDDREMEGPVWTPAQAPSLASDAWHPEDMLLLPLRGGAGELLGVVSVDQPALGRRPTEEEIGVLMAVVDHAGLALEQARRENARESDGSAELRLAAVMLLAETLDLRDASTALHSRTVGRLCRMTASVLGLSPERIERIHAAGVLHDLGKLGIADSILKKPGALTDQEWGEIRCHPEVGARILEHAGMRDIAEWVRAHHERVDGQGYPAGLSSGEIPLESRILAVADAYEAMVADRPYRHGMAPEEAREELLRCAGSQFDPNVVDAFLTAVHDIASGAEVSALEPVA